jgi:hypothetical protein
VAMDSPVTSAVVAVAQLVRSPQLARQPDRGTRVSFDHRLSRWIRDFDAAKIEVAYLLLSSDEVRAERGILRKGGWCAVRPRCPPQLWSPRAGSPACRTNGRSLDRLGTSPSLEIPCPPDTHHDVASAKR